MRRTICCFVPVAFVLAGMVLSLSARSSCTINVEPGESIQAAINAAPDGAVICLAEGEWKEDVTVTKSITLLGSGVNKTTIQGREEGWWPVVNIRPESGSTVSIENVSVASGNTGIWVRWGAQVQLSGVRVHGHRKDGIAAFGDATVVMRGVSIEQNGSGGITVSDQAVVTIADCSVARNGRHGLEAWGSPEIEVSESTLEDNGESGISVRGETKITIERCSVRSPVIGIAASGAARAAVVGSRIEGGKYGGVYVEETAQASIVGSTVSGITSFSGITIVDFAEASVTGSIVADHFWYGISVWGMGKITVSGCDVYGNTFGIVLADSAHATIVGNRISGNRQHGVALHEAPCFQSATLFTGYVTGRSNIIPGLLEPGGNRSLTGPLCSALWDELGFLTTAKGGALDGR